MWHSKTFTPRKLTTKPLQSYDDKATLSLTEPQLPQSTTRPPLNHHKFKSWQSQSGATKSNGLGSIWAILDPSKWNSILLTFYLKYWWFCLNQSMVFISFHFFFQIVPKHGSMLLLLMPFCESAFFLQRTELHLLWGDSQGCDGFIWYRHLYHGRCFGSKMRGCQQFLSK